MIRVVSAGLKPASYPRWWTRAMLFGWRESIRLNEYTTLGCINMADDDTVLTELRRAATAIHEAKAVVFTSGTGMGVDSGLQYFRGPEGF